MGEIEKAKRGPPMKATPETINCLCRCLAHGMTRSGACKVAGITHQTLCRWLRLADGDDFFAELAKAVEEAEGAAEQKFSDVVYEEAIENRNWVAASWWLQRRRKEYHPKGELVQEITLEEKPVPTVERARELMRAEFGDVGPVGEPEEKKDA